MSGKYLVTFYFKHCTPVVEVMADSDMNADAKARVKELGAPVPDNISSKIKLVEWGGDRKGAGAKKIAEPRNIKKQISHTKSGWAFVQKSAREAGMSDVDWQRMKIFGVK